MKKNYFLVNYLTSFILIGSGNVTEEDAGFLGDAHASLQVWFHVTSLQFDTGKTMIPHC